MTVLAQAQLNQRTTYVYGLGDSPLAGDDGSAWTYLSGRDALNSVRQETDAEGRVLAARSFDPYGVPRSGDGGEPFGYTGEYRDQASGLVFLRARYLQVTDGRFISRDVWPGDEMQPVTLGPWIYSYNNPLRWVDPSGKRAECGTYGGECGNTDGLWGQTQSGTYREYPGPGVSAEEVSRILGYVLKAELAIYTIPVTAANAPRIVSILKSAAGPLAGTGWQWLNQLRTSAPGQCNLSNPNQLHEGQQVFQRLDATKLRLTETVAKHLNDIITKGQQAGQQARPYGDVRLLVQEIMDAAPPSPDPGGTPGGLRWEVPGWIGRNMPVIEAGASRVRDGMWELVVNPAENAIVHLLFKGD